MSEWNTIRIPAEEHPNVREGETVIPGGPTRRWVRDMKREYGDDSPQVIARVEARFPETATDGLIRHDWLREAARRFEAGTLDPAPFDEAERIAAIDPSGEGRDATALAVLEGPVLRELEVWGGATDTTEIVRRVRPVLESAGIKPRRDTRTDEQARQRAAEQQIVGDQWSGRIPGFLEARGTVVVDSVGVGKGVKDRLEEMGYATLSFKGGGRRRLTAEEERQHQDLKAAAFWTLRTLLEDGRIALPKIDKLWRELTTIRWEATPSAKVAIESKEKLRPRLGRSPDRADAVSMAYWAYERGVGSYDASEWQTVKM